jgi:hypothetical protein
MGGQKQPSTTTQIQKVELPAWVDEASQDNYLLATEIGQTPYTAYTGDRVAGLSSLEQAAPGTLQTGIDATNAALGTALGAANTGAAFRPTSVTGPGNVDDVTAQSFLSRDINAYMDPNIKAILDPTMEGMRRNIRMGVQGIADTARGVGAWGGSRHGVAEAVYGAEGARNMALTEAQLRSGAFTDAASRIGQDNATALQAALANQQAGLTTTGMTQAAKLRKPVKWPLTRRAEMPFCNRNSVQRNVPLNNRVWTRNINRGWNNRIIRKNSLICNWQRWACRPMAKPRQPRQRNQTQIPQTRGLPASEQWQR